MGRRKGYQRKTTETAGILPFILEEVDSDEGNAITPRAGLISLAEIARAMKLPDVVRQQVQVKQRARGFEDWEFIESLLTLIADGGECLDDLSVLQSDATFQDLLGHGIPSPSAVKKYLYGFHDDKLFSDDQPMLDASFVPGESVPLMGLARVNDYLIRQAQRSTSEKVATLDQDATIIESDKACAKMTYEGVRGYQPMFVQWVEQDLIIADELRDGNVPAGKDVLRVARRAFEALPDDIEQVYYRGDSASYNHDLLNWLREEDAQTGRPRAIFAVSAHMTPELRRAVMACEQWHRDPDDPCRSWGEVDFVPSAPSTKKGRKPDRYLGIRIEPRQGELFADGSEVKHDVRGCFVHGLLDCLAVPHVKNKMTEAPVPMARRRRCAFRGGAGENLRAPTPQFAH
jgi:hypothetical protein